MTRQIPRLLSHYIVLQTSTEYENHVNSNDNNRVLAKGPQTVEHQEASIIDLERAKKILGLIAVVSCVLNATPIIELKLVWRCHS